MGAMKLAATALAYLAAGFAYLVSVFWGGDVLQHSAGLSQAWAYSLAVSWPALVLAPFWGWLLIIGARANRPSAPSQSDASVTSRAE